jgi:hypothetical protein
MSDAAGRVLPVEVDQSPLRALTGGQGRGISGDKVGA